MKKLVHVLLFLPFAILAGCDGAKYPIDDPAVIKTDDRLIGKWGEKKHGHGYYCVSKTDDYHYFIAMLSKKKDIVDSETAFLSVIDSARFLNIRSENDQHMASYIFLRILDIDTRKIKVAGIKDTMLNSMKSPSEIRPYIASHINYPALYSDTEVLYKVK
jgi:hypothetical protein